MIVYDNHFNINEWFVLLGLMFGALTMFLLPKRFPTKYTILYFLFGVFSGFLFDHTVSVQPVSFYDVNDVSNFEVMDFVSYWMYGPFSYLFFYVYDVLEVRTSRTPLYVCIWSLAGVSVEWLAVQAGVFHYSHGYKIFYSLPIYLMVQTTWVILYKYFQSLRMRQNGE